MTSDLFPLASGLAARLDDQIPAIIAGRDCELMDGVTPVTAELLRFWFQSDYCDLRYLNFHEGQRSAILHVIYAHEVLRAKRLQDLYREVAPDALLRSGVLGEVTRSQHDHPKYAAKMATGSGKTWVLNALLVWQYLNRLADPDDDRFTANFLIVAPGLIVYDRLLDSFLGKERNGERHFESSDLYATRDLFVPENFRDPVFGFLQSSVTTKNDIGRKVTGSGMVAITNWHLLAGVEDPDFVPDTDAPGTDLDPTEVIETIFPLTPGTASGNALDVLDRRYLRGGPLESLKDLTDLVVFNDEAHHIHEIKKSGEVTEVEWQRSLREIASTKGHRFVQIDFSATPYNQVGSGRKKQKAYFPHIVVDFDLNRAMSTGLVKLLALDKRNQVASLPLDFKAERDEQQKVVGLSSGQRVMLRAGLTKLQILEQKFQMTDPTKHPKLMVICEDTSVTSHVVEFYKMEGLTDAEIMAVDSNRKGEVPAKEWSEIRERLFDVDRHAEPKVIVSVLMLREGFDVNNICVVVPLRSSTAPILLEQTIGRGLRLMWRGDEYIDELKRETRERFRRRQEPTNYFDVLFIVEHPAFAEFYEDLLNEGLAGEVTEDSGNVNPVGDLVNVDLRDDFASYDFEIPMLVRDAEEELVQPSLDPLTLPASKYPFGLLKATVGRGDKFISEDAQTGTQYGDYRVSGGVMTATGYNDYLSRMTNRISDALGSGITKSAKTWSDNTRYPFLQAYRPLLTGWLDTYIRWRLFESSGPDSTGASFSPPLDPLEDENWRVLLLDDVAHHIAGTFATALTEAAANVSVAAAEVAYRRLSEVKTISVRDSTAVDVTKCIYPRLPIPSRAGGLERLFVQWADADATVKALAKIHEYRHDFLHRPYLKADGMPAYYSPDFILRTDGAIYIVETKAQSALNDENVQRKRKAALAWVDQINSLEAAQRDDRDWHYVLLGEQAIRSWKEKNATVSDLLGFARLREAGQVQERLL